MLAGLAVAARGERPSTGHPADRPLRRRLWFRGPGLPGSPGGKTRKTGPRAELLGRPRPPERVG
ncbi:hypothetical protein [Actinomadura formosensis]|uniref:hypothetical protein n=1 Tax=Actinomadura formosensis TaxID=60706 RepID=UPI003D905D34